MKKFSSFNNKTKNDIASQIQKFDTWMKENFNIQTYLFGGTLLGAVREKDFIPYDDDIDIGFYIGDYDNDTAIQKIKDFYKILHSTQMWRVKRNLHQIKILSPNKKILFDCWSTWSYKNKLYGGAIVTLRYPKGLEYSDFFPLKKIKFRGIELSIPKESEKLLNIHYVNWKTTISDKTVCFKKYNI